LYRLISGVATRYLAMKRLVGAQAINWEVQETARKITAVRKTVGEC
jgi:hypothetical protein